MQKILLILLVILVLIIIGALIVFLIRKERYENVTRDIPLMKASGVAYSVSKRCDMVTSISGFKPNSWVLFTVNDLEMKFQVDEKGFIYWNDKKEALPVYLLPYNELRVTNIDGPTGDDFYQEIESKPVQQCYDIEDKISLTQEVKFKMVLVYMERESKEIKKTTKTAIIQGGALQLSLY